MNEIPELKEGILDAVKEQLESSETVYVKNTYDRLIEEGIEKNEVLKLIGCVLTVELWEMVNHGRLFSESTYKQRLEGLPDTSWLDD